MIVSLLRSLRDASETLQRGDGGGKFEPGSRVLEMPAAFKAGSYEALLAALGKLRRMGPRHYWHVSERYIRSERMTKDLVNVGGAYFEAIDVTPISSPSARYMTGGQLAANVEVLHGVAQPKVSVVHRPGVRCVLVRAVVEVWDPRVERRALETALDSLSFLLPRKLELPSDVPVAA